MIYKVGQKIDKFKGHREEVCFDLDDSGAIFLVFFNKPGLSEINQFKSGASFEIKFNIMYNVIMMTVKIGTLNWMDAPYTPHLSPNLTKLSLPQEGEGLALTLILIDAVSGEIMSLRLIGLGELFSRKLIGVIMDESTRDFNKEEYYRNIERIMTAYPTNKIVKMSKDLYKLR